ncbi:hypothetical protein F5Y16DRAFT_411634 [Xylariaceae sp. FL0255]|nr:hypothetical protein F5Y16DRAFT_411634 [Xylariaceae sp. FL0255]
MNTATVSMAVTPTVLSTFLSHYLNRKPLRQRPTAHLSYDEGLHLIRSFLAFASQHTVEELQAFTAQWVPHPQWVKVEEVAIPQVVIEAAANELQLQLGAEGLKLVGGEKWWQWRRPGSQLKAEWIEMKADYNQRRKSGDPGNRVMLYVHGGAYFFGSVDEHRYQMQRHARKLKARVLAPRYRLSPQFPFPCGLHDCLATYLYLLETQDPSTIILAGDSAGGGMVLSMLVTLRDRGIPLPAGAILISPWVDLTHSFPSVAGDAPLDYIPSNGFHHKPSQAWPPLNSEEYDILQKQVEKNTQPGHSKLMKPATVAPNGAQQDTKNITETQESDDSSFPRGPPLPTHISVKIAGKEVVLKDQIQMYTTNEMLAHPMVSPVMQPTLGGLPPLLIMVGGGEILRDEQIYLAHKCANPAKYAPADIHMNELARDQLAKFKPTDVQLQVWDDLCHVAPTLSFTRPAKYMFRSIAQFGAWALARSQKIGIEIQDDDQISVISDSGSDYEDRNNVPTNKTASRSPVEPKHSQIGKAGDPLPTFKEHMIRQRVNRHGVIRHLEAATDLPGCTLEPTEIGVVKEGPVKKWLDARQQADIRFASARAKVHKIRLKEMKAGYELFEGETPPPSALAGRRKIGGDHREKKKRKSMGLALWSLWGSKHDETTVQKEEEAEKSPDVHLATNQEGQGARSPSDLGRQEDAVAAAAAATTTTEKEQRPKAVSRSRSRTRVVQDEHQTGNDEDGGGGDSKVDEAMPIATLMAMREGKLPDKGKPLPPSPGDSTTDLLTPNYKPPATGVLGKRPIVGGIAVPFSLGKEADTASMITLTSAMDGQSIRVASPTPGAALDGDDSGVKATSARAVAGKTGEGQEEVISPGALTGQRSVNGVAKGNQGEDGDREETPQPVSPVTAVDGYFGGGGVVANSALVSPLDTPVAENGHAEKNKTETDRVGNGGAVAAVSADGEEEGDEDEGAPQRPPIETFVTAAEELPRVEA